MVRGDQFHPVTPVIRPNQRVDLAYWTGIILPYCISPSIVLYSINVNNIFCNVVRRTFLSYLVKAALIMLLKKLFFLTRIFS